MGYLAFDEFPQCGDTGVSDFRKLIGCMFVVVTVVVVFVVFVFIVFVFAVVVFIVVVFVGVVFIVVVFAVVVSIIIIVIIRIGQYIYTSLSSENFLQIVLGKEIAFSKAKAKAKLTYASLIIHIIF